MSLRAQQSGSQSARLLDRSPGPASYNPPSSFGATKGANLFSFTSKPRVRPPRDNGPGPDKYVPLASTLSGPKLTMASRFRAGSNLPSHASISASADSSSVPGPGTYHVKGTTTLGSGPKYSLKGRLPVKNTSDGVPGAGRYDITNAENKIKYQPPSFSMGSKLRVPGTRRIRSANDGSSGIGGKGGEMDAVIGGESVPGPGRYEVPSTLRIGKSGISVSLAGRSRSCSKESGPAPGTYNTSNEIGGNKPKFSMARRYKDGVAHGYWAQDVTKRQEERSKIAAGLLPAVNMGAQTAR